MYINYKNTDTIKGVNNQHNIMIIVGNGFDISLLKNYGNEIVTSYNNFYNYLCKHSKSKDNLIFKKMTEDKENGKENWSDFEASLDDLIDSNMKLTTLEKDLNEIRKEFLYFLNDIVTPDILIKVNNDAFKYKWAKKSLSCFLKDLSKNDFENCKFPSKTNHYDMYNFLFVNFNYTPLLDSYIFLDKNQFDPHPYNTVDRNFSFYPNPNSYNKNCYFNSDTIWSTFIMTDIVHPHGIQSIPRSLLFGTENEKYKTNTQFVKFNKSYWAQDELKYKSYFEQTRLFIIYGTSMGKTDSWWWNNIAEILVNNKSESELIIYYYENKNSKNIDDNYVKSMFINSCNKEFSKEEKEIIFDKIFVVLYRDSKDHVLFGLNNI